MKELLIARAKLAKVDTGDDRWIVEGYAMTAGPKADGMDITLDAMRGVGSLEGLPVYLLGDHEGGDGDPDRLVGRVLSSFVDDIGTFVRVLISRAEENTWTKITEGILRDFSVLAKVAGQRLADGTLKVTQMAMRHLAIVVDPLDPAAQFSVARSGEGEVTEGAAADAAGEASGQGGGSGAGCGVGEAVVLAGMAAVTGAALMAAAAVMEE